MVSTRVVLQVEFYDHTLQSDRVNSSKFGECLEKTLVLKIEKSFDFDKNVKTKKKKEEEK